MRALRAVAIVVAALLAAVPAVLAWGLHAAAQREAREAREAAPPGRYVNAGDVELFVQERGPAGAPAILFIHGTGAWSGVWAPTLELAAAHGWHACALDLPPFGYSQRPADGDYSKIAQGRRIVRAMDSLGFDRVVLVGHSFGGGPTVEAAMGAPQRIARLVLVDAALGIGESSDPPRALDAVLGTPALRDALVATFGTNPRFTPQLLKGFVANPDAATPGWIAIYRRPLDVRGTTRAVSAWLPHLMANSGAAASQQAAKYAGLTMPVDIIWGRLDTITPPEQATRLASLLPHARLRMLDGVGHIPQIENEAAFQAEFLDAIGAAR